MANLLKYISAVFLLSLLTILYGKENHKTHALFFPRSQGINWPRRMAGWEYVIPGCDDRTWGDFSFIFEYEHSLKSKQIAQYLFGTDCLNLKGSQVENRDPKRDLLAENFGLSTHFIGKVCFNPRIVNWIYDFNYHLGLDAWLYGLYCKIFIPIVKTVWDIGLHCQDCQETNNIKTCSDISFAPCYMGPKRTKTVHNMCHSFLHHSHFKEEHLNHHIHHHSKHNIVHSADNRKAPIKFGIFSHLPRSATGIADVNFIVGHNFILNEKGHLGLFIQTVIPAGNKPSAEFIFEPIIGNGRLWELGAGISAHAIVFQSDGTLCGFFLESNFSYQFKKHQARSFDLINNGSLSRYMLLKEFRDHKYHGNLVNAINFTTRGVEAGGSVWGEACIKFSYYKGECGLDIGYDIYGKTRERLCIEDSIRPSDLRNNEFGIKGTEGTCFRIINLETGKVSCETHNLNSTQNNATITHGASIDNPQVITCFDSERVAITWDSPLSRNEALLKKAKSSNPPIYLRKCDLDIDSARIPSQLTHKVFAHISYISLTQVWEPQVGIGGEFELDGLAHLKSSLNKWAIWLKAGVSF